MDNEQALRAVFRELTRENQARLLREAQRSRAAETPAGGPSSEPRCAASAVPLPAR